MDTQLILDRLKSNRYKFFATITGGGTGAISRLLEQGGASSVFIGAEIPYGYDITETKPVKYVSESYAKELAVHSMDKIYAACPTLSDLDSTLGLGVSVALTKKDERAERPNEACMCLAVDNAGSHCWQYIYRHLPIDKTVFQTRVAQEVYVEQRILQFLQDFLLGSIQ